MQLFTLLTILLTYATYNTNTYTTCITYNTILLIALLNNTNTYTTYNIYKVIRLLTQLRNHALRRSNLLTIHKKMNK